MPYSVSMWCLQLVPLPFSDPKSMPFLKIVICFPYPLQSQSGNHTAVQYLIQINSTDYFSLEKMQMFHRPFRQREAAGVLAFNCYKTASVLSQQMPLAACLLQQFSVANNTSRHSVSTLCLKNIYKKTLLKPQLPVLCSVCGYI